MCLSTWILRHGRIGALALSVFAASCATTGAPADAGENSDGEESAEVDSTVWMDVFVAGETGAVTPLTCPTGACDPMSTGCAYVNDSGANLACRIVADDAGSPTTTCAPAATAASVYCNTDADCEASYACVASPNGICLAYCCNGPPDTGYYCALRPLAQYPSLSVPVQIPLDPCTILGSSEQCQNGYACTIVTNNGGTACIKTGTLAEGDRCDDPSCDGGAQCLCMAGFACVGSPAFCKQLCVITDSGDTQCPTTEQCVPQPSTPSGFGLCMQ
jgi:hypothetical protein